jgi:hypothetical protein
VSLPYESEWVIGGANLKNIGRALLKHKKSSALAFSAPPHTDSWKPFTGYSSKKSKKSLTFTLPFVYSWKRFQLFISSNNPILF